MQAFTQYSKQIYQSAVTALCGQRFRKRCEAGTRRESQISSLRFQKRGEQKRSWEKAPGPPTSVFDMSFLAGPARPGLRRTTPRRNPPRRGACSQNDNGGVRIADKAGPTKRCGERRLLLVARDGDLVASAQLSESGPSPQLAERKLSAQELRCEASAARS
jgi:hypothetical protein